MLKIYFSVWQWNYCMFISNFNNGCVYFPPRVCMHRFASLGWRLQHSQSPAGAAAPPTGTALPQFPQQQVFDNVSSGGLKLFLILIFIWVAYNQNNCQSEGTGLGNDTQTDSNFSLAKAGVNLNKWFHLPKSGSSLNIRESGPDKSALQISACSTSRWSTKQLFWLALFCKNVTRFSCTRKLPDTSTKVCLYCSPCPLIWVSNSHYVRVQV